MNSVLIDTDILIDSARKKANAIIAATAIESNITLYSKNYKDYQFIKELSLIPYKGI